MPPAMGPSSRPAPQFPQYQAINHHPTKSLHQYERVQKWSKNEVPVMESRPDSSASLTASPTFARQPQPESTGQSERMQNSHESRLSEGSNFEAHALQQHHEGLYHGRGSGTFLQAPVSDLDETEFTAPPRYSDKTNDLFRQDSYPQFQHSHMPGVGQPIAQQYAVGGYNMPASPTYHQSPSSTPLSELAHNRIAECHKPGSYQQFQNALLDEIRRSAPQYHSAGEPHNTSAIGNERAPLSPLLNETLSRAPDYQERANIFSRPGSNQHAHPDRAVENRRSFSAQQIVWLPARPRTVSGNSNPHGHPTPYLAVPTPKPVVPASASLAPQDLHAPRSVSQPGFRSVSQPSPQAHKLHKPPQPSIVTPRQSRSVDPSPRTSPLLQSQHRSSSANALPRLGDTSTSHCRSNRPVSYNSDVGSSDGKSSKRRSWFSGSKSRKASDGITAALHEPTAWVAGGPNQVSYDVQPLLAAEKVETYS